MASKTTMEHGIQIRQRILEFITQYILDHGYSPSVREIGEGVGLKSTSSVYSHMVKMYDSGMIETDAAIGTARAIRVPGLIRKEGQHVSRQRSVRTEEYMVRGTRGES